MSYMVTPFEVTSRTLSGPVRVKFVHLLAGIATRHSDTMDCVFLVDGRSVTVAISCADLAKLRQHDRNALSDQQLADIAACFLRRALEQGNDPRQAELLLGEDRLIRLAKELKYL